MASPNLALVTDQNYLPIVLKLIQSAKKSIDIMAFSFAIGSLSGHLNEKSAPFEIADALCKIKKKLGKKISIRLYLESVRDTSERNEVTANYLQNFGIEIVYGATHAKGICIDGKYLLLGSTNWTNQSISKNFEANLLIQSAAASKEFIKYLDYRCAGGKHGGIELKLPLLADGDFEPLVLDLIARAKRQIHFSIYFFNHRGIEKALVEAAGRGVKIQGLIHDHKSFALPYIWANHSTVKRLKKAGVVDLVYGSPSLFSHSKYIVIDQTEFALGTGNWLQEDVKIHPQLYLYFKSTEIAKGLVKHLKAQIKFSKSA